MKTSVFAAALLSLSLLGWGHASAGPGGLYVFGNRLTNAAAAQPLAIFQNKNIDGVVLFALWSAVEPSDGTYDWSSIDPDIKNAVAYGKKISIDMTAGNFTPPWIYAEKVPSVSLYFGAHDGAVRCSLIQLPAVWNGRYQAKFIGMMNNLVAHLKSIGAYASTAIVKLTGVNNTTPELHQTAVTCQGTDAPTIWEGIGYRPSLIIAAWERIASKIAALFPDKLLAVDTLTNGDFPLINNAGQTILQTDPTYVDVKATVLNWAVARPQFARRFAVQWDGLNSTSPAGTPPLEWQSKGAIVGWQTNAFGGPKSGALCGSASYNEATPCTEAGYQAILDNGIAAGAQYLEVFPANVSAFPTAIAEAHAKLAN